MNTSAEQWCHMVTMQLQAIWFFIVMDQTDLFKETNFLDLALSAVCLSLSVIDSTSQAVSHHLLLSLLPPSEALWPATSHCWALCSFCSVFWFMYLGSLCRLFPFDCLSYSCTVNSTQPFFSGSGTLRKPLCPSFFACIQVWVPSSTRQTCLRRAPPSILHLHTQPSLLTFPPSSWHSQSVFYLFAIS